MFRDFPGCSGMFRDVPECSGMFHIPGFIDGPNITYGNIISSFLVQNLAACIVLCNYDQTTLLLSQKHSPFLVLPTPLPLTGLIWALGDWSKTLKPYFSIRPNKQITSILNTSPLGFNRMFLRWWRARLYRSQTYKIFNLRIHSPVIRTQFSEFLMEGKNLIPCFSNHSIVFKLSCL